MTELIANWLSLPSPSVRWCLIWSGLDWLFKLHFRSILMQMSGMSAHAKSTSQCFVLIILIMAHCRAGWRFLLSTPISIIIIYPFRKCHCNLYIFVIWVLWIKQSIRKHQPTFSMVKSLVNPSTKLTFVQQDSNKIPFNECSLPNV